MSGPAESNGHSEDSGSVLANLPRTRPQRATARRDASRGRRTTSDAAAAPSANGDATATADRPRSNEHKPAKAAKKPSAGAPKARSTAAKARTKAAAATAPKPEAAPRRRRAAATRPAKRASAEEVPRQGFECEDDRATGAVPPPDTADFLSTAVEALGEIAKAGVSGGERVLRDVLSRLGR